MKDWARLLPILAIACGGDDEGSASEGTTSGGSVGASSASTAASGTPTAGEGDSSEGSGTRGTTTGEPDPVGVPAGGIRLTGLFANQGVDVQLVTDRIPIVPADRVAPLISGRGLLLRADYLLDADFLSRAVVGRLTIERPDGTADVYDDSRMIVGPADITTLGGTFQWLLEADEVVADASYSVELFELEGVESTTGDPAESLFASAELGAWEDRMVLDIMVVPFECAGLAAVEIAGDDLRDLEAFIFNTYPVQALNLTVHEVVYSNSCSEFDAAEFDLPDLREAESADPWVYYGGLLPGDGGGYSIATEGGDQMDYRRTFANHTWRDHGVTFDLFAHELGHNHGREHTFEDPLYPGVTSNQCGGRATYGYGLRPALMPNSAYGNDLSIGIEWIDAASQLLSPTDPQSCYGLPDGNLGNFNDMMSYQYPYWVSAYSYAAFAERIRIVSAWAEAGIDEPPALERPKSVGIFDPAPAWRTAVGR